VALVILCAALAVLLSAVNVYLRDTQHFVELIVGAAWFWATPILIPETSLHAKMGKWAVLLVDFNPLAYVVRGYRELILGHSLPVKDLIATAAFATASFVAGGLIFRYLKRGFADVL